MVALPLGHPAKITTHPLTYWRTLLAGHLMQRPKMTPQRGGQVVSG
jgi:hypothetical protein